MQRIGQIAKLNHRRVQNVKTRDECQGRRRVLARQLVGEIMVDGIDDEAATKGYAAPSAS
jgi:hypothetical protein